MTQNNARKVWNNSRLSTNKNVLSIPLWSQTNFQVKSLQFLYDFKRTLRTVNSRNLKRCPLSSPRHTNSTLKFANTGYKNKVVLLITSTKIIRANKKSLNEWPLKPSSTLRCKYFKNVKRTKTITQKLSSDKRFTTNFLLYFTAYAKKDK